VPPTIEPTAAPSEAPSPTSEPTPPPPAALDISTARGRAVGSHVTVEGTVTAQAGPILGDRTLVIQDASGGLPVRLPSVGLAADLPRGTVVHVSGELAAPYGNLELRPDDVADLTIVGSGGLPAAASLGTGGLKEGKEGLLATLTATIEAVDVYSSGAVSIAISDSAGTGKVYAFAPVGLDTSALGKDQRIKATGIVGQRASSSGAADGYRLWIRGLADLMVVTSAPNPTPTAGPGDGDTEPVLRRVKIADAAEGETVIIVGVVTSKAGLIDSEGRRVTVQDRSGAILVRYPAESTPARVGSVIRVLGEVGTWYEARQLEAERKPRRKRSGPLRVTNLRRPPVESEEWLLVRIAVRITDIERDGDTWRAEAELQDGSALPIVGLAGSGIDGDLLEPGRSARITGLVKRAHPSATDQRFAVAPRSRKDIRLGRLLVPDDDDAQGGSDDVGDLHEDGVFGTDADDAGPGVFAATFGTLEGLEDRLVRVGGRVEEVAERRLTLDDGTARGTVRLADSVERLEPAIEVGEVVNAVGRVRRHRQRGSEVIVESVADVRRAASLVGEQVNDGFAPVDGRIGPSALPVVEVDHPDEGPLIPVLPLLLLAGILGLVATSFLAAAGYILWRSTRTAPAATEDAGHGVG